MWWVLARDPTTDLTAPRALLRAHCARAELVLQATAHARTTTWHSLVETLHQLLLLSLSQPQLLSHNLNQLLLLNLSQPQLLSLSHSHSRSRSRSRSHSHNHSHSQNPNQPQHHPPPDKDALDRTRGAKGKRVSVRVDRGGRRQI